MKKVKKKSLAKGKVLFFRHPWYITLLGTYLFVALFYCVVVMASSTQFWDNKFDQVLCTSFIFFAVVVLFREIYLQYIYINFDREKMIIRQGFLPESRVVINLSEIDKIHFVEGNSRLKVWKCQYTLALIRGEKRQVIEMWKYMRLNQVERWDVPSFYLKSQQRRFLKLENRCNMYLSNNISSESITKQTRS